MEKPHKKLTVWQKSMTFVKQIYEMTETFPSGEKFGLVSQIRRSAFSIPSNIAEGTARKGDAEFIQFIHIALGSVSELDTQLELCNMLGLITSQKFESLDQDLAEIDKMLVGLRNKLKK